MAQPRRKRDTHRPYHQRSPRPELARRANASIVRSSFPGPLDQSHGRTRGMAIDPSGRPGRVVGDPQCAQDHALVVCSPAVSTSDEPAERESGIDRFGDARGQPRRIDDRFWPKICNLQTRQHDLSRSRSHRGDRQRSGPPGSDFVRRQSAPQGRTRQAIHPGDRQSTGRFTVCWQSCIRRGLRHQRMPAFDPRGRCVAQQSKTPLGGLRDKRTKSHPQWGVEPEHSRRMVGGGL